MPEPMDPKYKKLFELAKRRHKLKLIKAMLSKALANWPTRKEPAK